MRLKGKVTARDKNMQGGSQAQNQNVRDNGRKRRKGFLTVTNGGSIVLK